MRRAGVRGLFGWGILLGLLGWSGCSGKSTPTVTLSPATSATINQGQTLAVTATVTNDKSNQGVTWSVGTGVGSLANVTTTGVTYVAPPTLTTTTTVTLTATSVANTASTASLTITVNALLAVSTTSLPFATQGVSYFTVVSATGSAGPFTWSLTAGTLPAGLTISNSTADSVTISGTPTLIGKSTFTLEVQADGFTASQTLSISVNPPPPLSVATRSLSEGTVGIAYNSSNSQTLQASSGTPPYSWSIISGALPAGLTLSGAIISGTPTTAGTANFTVQVVDSSTPVQTATADLSLTINPSTANNAKLDGNYAFVLSGFDPGGQFALAGSFLADGNGHVTNGVLDVNDRVVGVQTSQPFTGTYLVGSNSPGTMTLNVTGAGSRSFLFTLNATGNAKLIECDGATCTTSGSGVMLRQTTTDFSQASILNNYTFGLMGGDASGTRFAVAGEFHADGKGNLTTGTADSDDGTSGGSSLCTATCTGTYTAPATSGRGTATLTVPGAGTTNYSYYMVTARQLLMVEIDQTAGSAIVSGQMLQQSGTGSFGSSSLNGTAVFETSAVQASNSTPVSQLGLFTADGTSAVTTTSDLNTDGVLSSPTSTGTYSVAVSGRVTLSNSGIGSSDPVLYIVSSNQAFILGTDTNVTFGYMQPQNVPSPPGTFMPSALSGAYAGGSLVPVQSGASVRVDIGVGDGVSTVALTSDVASSSGLAQNQSSSPGFSLIANGRGELTENAAVVGIFYMVSSAEFVEMSTDTLAALEDFQQ